MNTELKQRLSDFLDELPVDIIAKQVAMETSQDSREINDLLVTYRNEAYVTFDLIDEHLIPGMQILEVGAGLCLLSLFLKREGYHITALEPALGGYGLFEQTKDAIRKYFSEIDLHVLDCPAQALQADIHGRYQLVYSNNVLEHIPAWQEALSAMANVLTEDGIMLHACPNYSFPYEPHYSVPVLRRLPTLTRSLLASDQNLEIWDSLNFIAAHQVKAFATSQGLHYQLVPGLLYRAFARFEHDPLFAERHGRMLGLLAKGIIRSGLGALIKKIPANMVTPMIIEIRPRIALQEEH